MHTYLKSLGFSKYKDNKKIRKLLDKLQDENKQFARIIQNKGEKLWEIKLDLDTDLSLVMLGIIDDDGNYIRQQAYPCLKSHDISSSSYCTVQRHISNEEYSGMIDDNRVGISLIFRLSNAFDYIERKNSKLKSTKVKNVYISAWSEEAKILLPVKKSKMQVELLNLASKERNSLIEKAKNGDENAIESLSMEDMNLYTMVNDRILNEDLYSIVDNSFMPQGIECDIYMIVADITGVSEKVNSLTKEKIYNLTLSCNDINLHLAVNKKDVIGEVSEGRRVKAKIWLQADVEFEETLM